MKPFVSLVFSVSSKTRKDLLCGALALLPALAARQKPHPWGIGLKPFSVGSITHLSNNKKGQPRKRVDLTCFSYNGGASPPAPMSNGFQYHISVGGCPLIGGTISITHMRYHHQTMFIPTPSLRRRDSLQNSPNTYTLIVSPSVFTPLTSHNVASDTFCKTRCTYGLSGVTNAKAL